MLSLFLVASQICHSVNYVTALLEYLDLFKTLAQGKALLPTGLLCLCRLLSYPIFFSIDRIILLQLLSKLGQCKPATWSFQKDQIEQSVDTFLISPSWPGMSGLSQHLIKQIR